EEIHDRRAAESDRRVADTRFEHRAPLGALELTDRDYDLDAAPHAGGTQRIETTKLIKEILLRKGEVLLQESIRLEGSAGIRQHSFVRREAHRLERLGIDGDRFRLRHTDLAH